MIIVILRTIILYLSVVIALRLMGKRQVGELEPSELVITIMISELASVPMQEPGAPMVTGLIPIIVLVCLGSIMSTSTMKSITLRKLFCGKPSIVIEKGKILQNRLKQNNITIDELLEELRLQDITDLSTVQYAILETSGKLSALLYAENTGGLPITIINDGKIMDENLQKSGLTKEWITKELKSRGVTNPADVFLLTVDEQNCLYFLPKEGTAG